MLLSLAMRRGVTVSGQAEAITHIGRWLDTWRQDSPRGPWWPELLTVAELHSGRPAQAGPRRPSWCYGTPGLARAQQLAGIVLGDADRQERAEAALAHCLADPLQQDGLTGPGICHGRAGVLAVAHYAAADARTSVISSHLPALLNGLLDDYDRPRDSTAWQRPGLIDGRAGIAAILHTILTARDGMWASCLLLT